MAGVDHDQRALDRPGRGPGRRGAGRGRAPGRLQVDHIAVVFDAVAGRQQETALDLGAGRQVQLDPRGRARSGHPPAAHQSRARAGQRPLRRHAGQGQDHPAVVARLDHLTARRPVQVEDHPRVLGVAAEADTQNLAHRARRQAPSRRQQGGAKDEQGHGRDHPVPDAPLPQIGTQQAFHQAHNALGASPTG
jgi:hypothetical protein